MPQNEHPVALCKDAAVDVNKNLVRILAEQNVRPHLSASDVKKSQLYVNFVL